MYDFDLVLIGSGPAGEKGSVQAAYFGKKVALVEKEELPGGVPPWRMVVSAAARCRESLFRRDLRAGRGPARIAGTERQDYLPEFREASPGTGSSAPEGARDDTGVGRAAERAAPAAACA